MYIFSFEKLNSWKELGFIDDTVFNEVRKRIEKLANMLNALKKSQLQSQ
ncbi:hypothetical protein [uncultured Aquimarina sp.]|nr:hypothetical protein [uncultured Aquimarina sp.]